MGLTILLTVIMMALLFLMIWSATLTLPYKGLAKNFPKDVQERLEPRLNSLPMSARRVVGWIALIAIGLLMIGVFVWGGLDGIRRGYGFGRLFLRFLVIGTGVKAFDIIGLDFFLLTKTHFFQHYFPETEGCAGWQDFGFNRRQQLAQIIMLPFFCLLTAWIFTLIA
ncbi:MAG: hypothetical protein IJV41_11945 [Oscillospiraceae bacterium]|nr:hypothetical protein [Oscillospiraceae bacterium]